MAERASPRPSLYNSKAEKAKRERERRGRARDGWVAAQRASRADVSASCTDVSEVGQVEEEEEEEEEDEEGWRMLLEDDSWILADDESTMVDGTDRVRNILKTAGFGAPRASVRDVISAA